MNNTANAMTLKLQHCSSTWSFKISDDKILETSVDRVGLKQLYIGDFGYHALWSKVRSGKPSN